MPFLVGPWALRALVLVSIVGAAASAAAASSGQSPTLARRALDARVDRPIQQTQLRRPQLFIRSDGTDFREQLIGLLPGQALEDVARTLASRTVQVDISSDRAFVALRLPLG